jgi:putative hydrolase of the HAD superfamily
MTIKAVVFDSDGVLLFPWQFRSYLEQEHRITPEMTRPFFTGIFEACLVGKEDLRVALPPYLAEWGWKGTLDEFIKTWFDLETAVDGRIAAAIRKLRFEGMVCCLATVQERYRADYMRTRMGLVDLFDRLFFSCEIGWKKSHPSFYRHIQVALGLAGEEILFWDDTPPNVEAARSCGWKAKLYTDFETFAEAMREYTNTMMFASSFSGKWGDYDPAAFSEEENPKDRPDLQADD